MKSKLRGCGGVGVWPLKGIRLFNISCNIKDDSAILRCFVFFQGTLLLSNTSIACFKYATVCVLVGPGLLLVDSNTSAARVESSRAFLNADRSASKLLSGATPTLSALPLLSIPKLPILNSCSAVAAVSVSLATLACAFFGSGVSANRLASVILSAPSTSIT